MALAELYSLRPEKIACATAVLNNKELSDGVSLPVKLVENIGPRNFGRTDDAEATNF
jgi:hypothetical protein